MNWRAVHSSSLENNSAFKPQMYSKADVFRRGCWENIFDGFSCSAFQDISGHFDYTREMISHSYLISQDSIYRKKAHPDLRKSVTNTLVLR